MADRRRWDIHARTQMMSLGPALLLTLMLKPTTKDPVTPTFNAQQRLAHS